MIQTGVVGNPEAPIGYCAIVDGKLFVWTFSPGDATHDARAKQDRDAFVAEAQTP